ncbi:MAG: D-aminoacyl-tRNA deacylase [Candidatus Omnitrophota bacterium]|nr:D-aminoacyl-tRNA deacylase [Candidatus Omnitrophota bacterium]
MRLVIQRVKQASVKINSKIIGSIQKGILVFLAVGKDDSSSDADYLANKLIELRLFPNGQDKMNLSISEISGGILVVSQFTLLADCVRGRRPSFDFAAEPKLAEELYNHFINSLKKSSLKVETGEFRAMMEVELINDGPVTFIIDSKNA